MHRIATYFNVTVFIVLLGANEPQYHWKDITDDFTAASDGKESKLFTE